MEALLTILSPPYLEQLFDGVLLTLGMTVAFLVIGTIWGIALTILRSVKGLGWLVAAYVSFHRNIPLLVQILFWYFAVAEIVPLQVNRWINQFGLAEVAYATIAISLSFGAFVSEDIRSGIASLEKVQFEAARAIGLTFVQAMLLVILPQAVRIAMPALTNQVLLFFKGTSLASAIGVAELTHAAHSINDETFMTFQVFGVATVVYLGLSLIIMYVSERLSKRGVGRA